MHPGHLRATSAARRAGREASKRTKRLGVCAARPHLAVQRLRDGRSGPHERRLEACGAAPRSDTQRHRATKAAAGCARRLACSVHPRQQLLHGFGASLVQRRRVQHPGAATAHASVQQVHQQVCARGDARTRSRLGRRASPAPRLVGGTPAPRGGTCARADASVSSSRRSAHSNGRACPRVSGEAPLARAAAPVALAAGLKALLQVSAAQPARRALRLSATWTHATSARRAAGSGAHLCCTGTGQQLRGKRALARAAFSAAGRL